LTGGAPAGLVGDDLPVRALGAAGEDASVRPARILLLGVLVTMLVSTSVAVGLELAAYVLFAAAADLRRRVVFAVSQPVVAALLVFGLVVAAATAYGPASWNDALGALAGWRRLLLLPLAVAVFDTEAAKRLFLKTLVVTCVLGTVASFLGVLSGLPNIVGQGIVFRNYATQGMTLSLGAIVCMAALLRPKCFSGDRLLGHRPVMAAALAAMVFDVIFILEGRSGYVSLAAMSIVTIALLIDGSGRRKALAAAAVLVCVATLVVSSTHARHRIEQALHEIATVDEAPQGTALGMRVVMWRNTLRMLRDHPLLGVGTGGFQDGYRAYVQGTSGWQGWETGDPHNQFLKIAGEQGAVGLAALLLFLLAVLRHPAPEPYRQLAAAAVVGWCATSLANSHFSTFVEARLFFLFAGAMVAVPRLPRE
jgi:O-antigen ligase